MSRRKAIRAFTLICMASFAAPPVSAGPSVPFFHEQWNGNFHLRAIESGDTLSVGGVFCNGTEVFVFDEAAGAVVALDSAGNVVSVSRLEPSARGGYHGDDFAELNGEFIFLNTVDKRLDRYDRYSGKHRSSVPLPADALAGQRKRSHRIINRIFISGGRVVIGNEHLLFYLDDGLKGTVSDQGIRKAPDRDRFALFSLEKSHITRDGFIMDMAKRKKAAVPRTHYAINGKRFFSLKGRLYAVSAAREGITIVELW